MAAVKFVIFLYAVQLIYVNVLAVVENKSEHDDEKVSTCSLQYLS